MCLTFYDISNLSSLIPSFNQCIDSLIDGLKEFPDGCEIPMNNQFSLFVMDLICRVSSLKVYDEDLHNTMLTYYSIHANQCILVLLRKFHMAIIRAMILGGLFPLLFDICLKACICVVRESATGVFDPPTWVTI